MTPVGTRAGYPRFFLAILGEGQEIHAWPRDLLAAWLQRFDGLVVLNGIVDFRSWVSGLQPDDWVFFWLPFEWPTAELIEEFEHRRQQENFWQGELAWVGRYWWFNGQDWLYGGFFPDYQPRLWKVRSIHQIWESGSLKLPTQTVKPHFWGPIQKRVEPGPRWEAYWRWPSWPRAGLWMMEIFWRVVVQWGWLEGSKACDWVLQLAAWKASRPTRQQWQAHRWSDWIYLLESV